MHNIKKVRTTFLDIKKHPESIAIRAFQRAARSGIEPLILP